VCGVDRNQRIVFWSRVAGTLLGLDAVDVRGRSCFDVFGGVNENGQAICGVDCPLFSGARRGEVVPTRTVRVRGGDGEDRWLSVTTLPIPPGSGTEAVLVHLFRDVSRFKACQDALELMRARDTRHDMSENTMSAPSRLTRRERDVLRLLASGKSTALIADALSVSPSTVRNHVHSIFAKLGVHSRLEAVTAASRLGLI